MTTTNPASSGSERRGHPRALGPFDGSWTGESGGRAGRIWDVSQSGCFVDALNDQRSGELVTVSIEFPEGRVGASGEVVYSIRNQGFAMRFTHVSPESMAILRRALHRLLGADSER